MAISHLKSKRKATGGRYSKLYRKQKSAELGSDPTYTKLGALRKKTLRVRGGNMKYRLFANDTANVLDRKTNKFVQAKIITIKENPANRNFTVRNIMTKGSIIQTDKGLAKITSRPGQDGIINAVLMEK